MEFVFLCRGSLCRGSLCRGYPVVGVRPKPSSNFYQRRLGRLGRVRNKNIKMADERDPAERVRKLVQFAGQVAVDNSIAPKKYFRSGVEMERMVSVSLYVLAEVSKRCPNLQKIEITIGIVSDTF